MKSIFFRLMLGHLEACDFKMSKHHVENGKMMMKATVPGVRFTKFKVEYFGNEVMIISYSLWGLWRYTLHLSFKKSNALAERAKK